MRETKTLGRKIKDVNTDQALRLGTITAYSAGPPRTVTATVGGQSMAGIPIMDHVHGSVGLGCWFIRMRRGRWIGVGLAGQATWQNWTPVLDASPTPTWQNWTPVLDASPTPPNIGSTGDVAGRYFFDGRTVHWNCRITFNGTGITGGSGTWRIAPPVAHDRTVAAGSGGAIGQGFIYDNTDAQRYPIGADMAAIPRLFRFDNAADPVDGTNPITIAAGDAVALWGTYEAD